MRDVSIYPSCGYATETKSLGLIGRITIGINQVLNIIFKNCLKGFIEALKFYMQKKFLKAGAARRAGWGGCDGEP